LEDVLFTSFWMGISGFVLPSPYGRAEQKSASYLPGGKPEVLFVDV